MRINKLSILKLLFVLVIVSFVLPKSNNLISISHYLVLGYDSNVSKISFFFKSVISRIIIV